jgi:hypothetical protein
MLMRRVFTAAGVLAALLLSGCSHAPIVAVRHPNPPPPPGYKVICSTSPIPIAAAVTSCIGVIAPDDRVVLRVRG